MKLQMICCLLIAMPVQANEWGRLFFTQQERQEGVSAPAAADHTLVSARRFDGELQTPRGKVRWVNGEKAQPPAGKKPGDIWQE
ncbi:hypothetical protein [Deefgea rivuli]|uniref:hypothetical protein n=1 Tax=Deefgea rivuli TaxID=400948 RepID=UPI000480107F|nr:hypothetical protein [Deefgea rivuli]